MISIFVLLPLYAVGIQYERKSLPIIVRSFCEGVACLALVVDVWCNYTELMILTLDIPKIGEWTFSTRLNRLVKDAGWRGKISLPIAHLLNKIAPNHNHIIV